MVDFLIQAFDRNNDKFTVRVRPHPLMSIEKPFVKNRDMPAIFQVEKDLDLERSLSMTDMLIYASSTVALEALYRGIPVIYIDFRQA
jgi:CDP-glycerol glycerophosphotransferase (TagB/SpsB family)